MKNIDQVKYINGLKSGDRNLFRELFSMYYEPLCKHCLRVIRDYDEVEEIVQDVFVNLWTQRAILNIETSSFARGTFFICLVNELSHLPYCFQRIIIKNELIALNIVCDFT